MKLPALKRGALYQRRGSGARGSPVYIAVFEDRYANLILAGLKSNRILDKRQYFKVRWNPFQKNRALARPDKAQLSQLPLH